MPFERNLWDWLRSGLSEYIADRRLHICRVENSVMTGYPDVEGCFRGRSFHIELKGALRPARRDSPVNIDIDRAQVLWLKRRWDAGGSCFVLLRVGQGQEILRYLVLGSHAGSLEGGLKEETIRGMSIVAPDSGQARIIERAAGYRDCRL